MTTGQSVPAADVGKLVFTPVANGNGDAYASFTFRVHDGTDESAASYVMTVNVTAMNDPATGAPAISGTGQVGMVLTASPGTIADADGLAGVSYSYQWIQVDGVAETEIGAANTGSYTPVRADVGKTLKVRASFTDADSNDEGRTSEPTATVLDTPVGICGRTPQVRDALVALIPGVSNCADVTAPHLAAITGKLELFGQQITALAVGDFAGLTSLTHLSLHTNALTTLPTGVFAELTSLTRLSLYSNALTTLPTGVFAELTALTELLLGSNQLSTLPDRVFDGLTRLETLALRNNALTMLDAGVFAGLTSLTSLNLYDTRLVTLSDDVFKPLTALAELRLGGNSLTTLPAEVFNGLTSLTVLRLAHNELTTLDAGVFDGLTSLTQLYLNNNELTTLDDDVFEPLTALTALRLRDNPGAPFAPDAVALPDDGTVSAAGGTVTLDGSGSGGPWGTNVTYGWALTDPVSGVTVTFDDDTSATPVVTIPALAEGTGRTFTLTVTGRGGTDGSVPATDTATVTAISDDATLSALTVNDGTNDLTLAPAFASGTFAYAADVAHAVDEVTLSATVNHAGASVSAVTLNGTAVADSDFTDGITVPGLLAGGNEIVVTVTVGDTSATRTYTVTVTANTAPTALDALVTTNEDTAYTFGAADFNFDDTDTGDALASVTVVTLLAAGALELDGTAVTTGQSVPAADIGKLVFTPVANGNGDAYASFTFRVHDGTDESASSYVMTVNVTAMNDPATGAPAISGTGQVGMVLTASPGTIADADGLAGVSYSYQWIQVDGVAETEIGAANTGSYTPVRADVGKTLKVRASFTDADSNDEGRTSEPTAAVTAAPTAPAIGDASASEGDAITFTVTLADAATRDVTVDYATSVAADDTAAQTDFTARSGTVTFAVGETVQTFTVSTLEDRIDESGETFTVTLDNVRPAGAATLPADPTATGTIMDDDAAPVLVLSVAPASIAESGGTSTVTVSTGTGSTFADEQTIALALSGTATEVEDYTISSKSLTLPAGVGSGASSVRATVTAEDDDIFGGAVNKQLSIAGSRRGANFGATRTITIIENEEAPKLTLTLTDDSISENGGSTTVTASVAPRIADAFTVTFGIDPTAPATAADYDLSGTLSFAALSDSPTGTVTIAANDNRVDRSDKTVSVTGRSSRSYFRATEAVTLTIEDEDAPPVPVLEVSTSSIAENGGTSIVTVTTGTGSTYATDQAIMLSLSGTATVASDYSVDSTLTLPAGVGSGASTVTTTVTGVDDRIDDDDETVVINASRGGTGFGSPQAVAITDDDAAPVLVFSALPASIAENGGVSTVTVGTGTGSTYATAQTITLAVAGTAIEGSDYKIGSRTLRLPAGVGSIASSVTTPVTGLDDGLFEGEADQTVLVTATHDGTDAGTPQTVAVVDDEANSQVVLTLTPDTIEEARAPGNPNANSATVTATVSPPAEHPFVVQLGVEPNAPATANDYTTAFPVPSLGLLDFAAEATASTGLATIYAVDNDVDTPDKTLTISGSIAAYNYDGQGLRAPRTTGILAPARRTLTIRDDDEAADAVSLSLDVTSVAEAAGPTDIEVTATLNSGARESVVVVTVTVGGGTGDDGAVSGADFNPVEAFTLSILAGEPSASANFTLMPLDDRIDESDEVLSVTGTTNDPLVGVPEAVGITITDNDEVPVLTLEVAPDLIAEDGGTATVTVTTGTGSTFGSAQAITLVLGGTATQGEDYTVSATQLTLPADAASVTATVTGLDDGVFEGDETLLISGQVDGAVFGEQQTLTITDNEGSPQVTLVLSPDSIAEDGGVSTVTATADAPATEADFTLTGATLSFAANAAESTGEVTIAAVDNGVDAANKTVRVTGSVSSAGIEAPADATLTILDDDTAPVLTILDDDAAPALTLEVAPATIAEDGGTATVTVATGTGSTFGSAQAITLVLGGTATQGEDYTVSATQLTLTAGAASVTATVTGLDDGVFEGDETLVISGQADGAAFGEQQTLTITDNEEAPRVTLVLSPDSIAEDGGVSTATATVSPASAEAFTVTVAATADAPATDADFTLSGATLSFAANAAGSTGEVTIAAVDNDEDTPDKMVSVSGTVSLDSVTAPASVTVTINDDDEPPPPVQRGVDISPTALIIGEGDDTGGSYNMNPIAEPSEDVTVTVSAPAGSGLMVAPAQLTFTSANWQTTQKVTITAGVDDDSDDQTVTLTHAAAGAGYESVTIADVMVTVTERIAPEMPELRVADARGREAEGQLIFDLTLNRAAEQAVSVAFATRDGTARAGEDYDALAGTATIAAGARATRIAVPVRVDLFREADESFLLMLSGADGARLADGEAIGVIEDEAALASQWLARFGRLAGDHVMAAVEEQITAPRGDASHVTVAGHRLTGGTGSFDTGARRLDPLGQPGFGSAGAGDRFGPAGRTLSGRDLLANSAFLLNAGPGGGQGTSVWGRGDYTRFDHLGEGLQGGGEALSATVGVDWACARCLVGIALSHTAVEGGYGAAGQESGTLESSVTGLYPYFGVQLAERFSVWGLAGQGQGELIAAPATGARTEKLDIETGLAGFGARAELISPDKAFSLAVKTEAFVSRATSGEAAGILEAEGEWRRVRLGLEGSWLAEFDTGASLRSSLEVAALQDAGDAENGRGAEVGASLRLIDVAPGLSLSLGVRGLVSHESEEYEEWGGSGGLRYDPEPDSAAGPLVSLTHSWGAAQSGGLQQALRGNGLSRPPMPLLARREEQLSAEFAWGFEAFGALGVPWARVGTTGAGEDYRVGYSLFTHRGTPSLELGRSALGRETRVGWAFTVRCRAQVAVQVLHAAAGPGERTNTGFELTLRSIAPGGRPGAASCDTLQPLFTSVAPR